MRAVWWCAAAALLAVAGAGTIRRTSSVDASSRSGRRFTTPDPPEYPELERIDATTSTSDPVQPRSYSRRRNGSVERESTRTRSRPIENPGVEEIPATFTRRKVPQSDAPTSYVDVRNNERNENSNSRSRYSRTRKKPVEINEEQVIYTRNKPALEAEVPTRTPSRSRTRASVRVAPTPATVEVSSPFIDEKKIEVISSTLDDITQTAIKEDALKARSTERSPPRSRQRTRFTSRVTAAAAEMDTENTATKRSRGRITTNSRTTSPKPDISDSVSSETINDVTIVYKEQTTARTSNDLKNSRKLRYKTRLSETDSNLTGDGIPVDNEEIKSSQSPEPTSSQTEQPTPSTRITFRPKVTRKPYQPTASAPESGSEAKSTGRRRVNIKASASSKKSSQSANAEIGEDDNYPESFKALLQAKNASQQAVTPNSESLSVKASQKVYNTFSPTSTDTKSSNAQIISRFRPSKNVVQASKRIDSVEEKEIIDNVQQSSTSKPFRKPDLKVRPSYLARYRKSTSMSPSTTESSKVVIDKQKYKFSRPSKLNATGTTTSNGEQRKTRQDERSKVVIKKPILRSGYYSRLRTTTLKPEIVSKIEVINEADLNSVEDEDSIEKVDESEDVAEPSSLVGKYHSSYKDEKSSSEKPNRENTFTPGPTIRNIHSRQSLAKARTVKPDEYVSDITNPDVDFDDISSKKYSDSYSKTTVPTTNVIPEFEKAKSRFSSKYRAPLDRPVYLPTVPSVTPSTAWLKFYATDSQLADTLSDTNWYLYEDENDIADSMIRETTNTQHSLGSAAADPDVGEENEIGPGINVISFSKPQSTPSSADLKLAETVPIPSQLINVETSLHSPSVTISIFDALAEILTSTPKTTTSTTTEAKPTPETQITANQTTLNGVSSNQPIYLSVPQSSTSENTLVPTSSEITANTKPVQNIIQPNIHVINNDVSPETSAAPPTSADATDQPTEIPPPPFLSPVPTSPLTPTPTPRRPFATIFLYSTSVPPTTDAFSTASQPTTNRPSTTESSSMVFNTVSDLILSNNNLISSELTSMLSSNIRDILLNMDEDTRAKVSVNMNAILRSLSVRALDSIPSDTDAPSNTTPFSEEDILATQLNDTAIEMNDNDTETSITSLDQVVVTTPRITSLDIQNNVSYPDITTPAEETSVTINMNVSTVVLDEITAQNIDSMRPISILSRAGAQESSTKSLANEIPLSITTPSTTNDVNIIENSPMVQSPPLPFISNLDIQDDSSDELTNSDVPSTLTKLTTENVLTQNTTPNPIFAPLTLHPIMEGFGFQDPCLLTPAQFWGLSKKARVLKIIEDIIRQHNVELMTTVRTPLTAPDVTMSLIRNIPLERLPASTERITSDGRIKTTDSTNTEATDIKPGLGARIANLPTTLAVSPLPLTIASTTDGQPQTDDVTTTFNLLSTSTEATSRETSPTAYTNSVFTKSSFIDMTSPSNVPTEMSAVDVTTTLQVQPSNSLEISSTDPNIPTLFTRLAEITPVPSELTASAESTTLSVDTTAQDGSLSSSTTTASGILETTSAPTSIPALLSTTTIPVDTTSENDSADSAITEAQSTDKPNTASKVTTEITLTTIPVDTFDNETTTTTIMTPVATTSASTFSDTPPKKDYVIFGILPNNTVVRKNPNEDPLETLTEASPYIIYGILPNNTIIRRFPNGTRVPRVMQRIDVLPISPWSLRNPYSPIHNNPAIVKPSNLVQQSITVITPSNNASSNGMEITGNSVNNTQPMISSQALSVNGKGTLATLKSMSGAKAAGTSTPSHVLSLRTTTMLPSINEILLNSISSATKEEQIVYIPAMTSSTSEPRILTLDIDPETRMIRTERPENGMGAVFKFIPIDEVKVEQRDSNVFKLASTKSSLSVTMDVSSSFPGDSAESVSEETNETVEQAPTIEVVTTERVTTTTETPTTTTTERTTAAPTTTTTTAPSTTTTTLRTTTNLPTTEDIVLPINILPTMFPPRRVQFRTTTPVPAQVTTTTQRRRIPTTTESTEELRISTTFLPVFTSRTRPSTTTSEPVERFTTPISGVVTTDLPFSRRVINSRFGISTTNVPSTSTFSVEDDIAFLENLKSVVNTNDNDPETALANRIISLAVERSLNDLSTNKDSARTGKRINAFGVTSNRVPVTTTTTTTTPRPTTTTTQRSTTTTRPTTTPKTTPSIEEDIRQFQEDTKLLQALLKATGQNPADFKIPALPTAKPNVRSSPNKIPSTIEDDLKLLGNLLASPSPLNEPFDSLTPRSNTLSIQDSKAENSITLNVKPLSRSPPTTTFRSTSLRSNNAITPSIKDDLMSFQEDTKLLQTLLQLQGGKPTTTPKNKVAITGLTGDEALATLLAQTNKVSAATKAPIALSTEYGKTNDALLAALLKEQGFGPTTANSIEEQIKLAALLNQVVVTPKARRVTTTAAPAPAGARRPIIDGLAWLWQQWQDTAPGPGPTRGARRPSIASPPKSSAATPSTSPRVNWFGSGPFVGNAEDAAPATSNRIPLEPPVDADPGRGQLVSAAINVTRAFSQFLGAAIQGAAKTVQNVIKAGRQAANDVYTSGSG